MAELAHKRHTKTAAAAKDGSSLLPLGLGEYGVQGSDTDSGNARDQFFIALDAEAPHVYEELRIGFQRAEESFALDAWAAKHRLLHGPRPPRWIKQTARLLITTQLQMAYEEPVNGGADPLPGRPVQDLAQDPSSGTCAIPNPRRWPRSASDWPIGNFDPERDTRILIDTRWDPSGRLTGRYESEDDVLAGITTAVKTRLNEIKQIVIDAGGIRTPFKAEMAHFGWLVRYLVNRESPLSISRSARPFRAQVPAIKKALRETAQLLGLDLPAFDRTGERGGRPVGSRNRGPRSKTS